MKKERTIKYVLSILFVFTILPGLAQQKAELELIGSPYGFYIKINNQEVVNQGFQVLRKEEGNSFEPIGVYSPTTNAADLYRKMTDFTGIFPNYQNPTRVFTDTIWQRYQSGENIADAPYPLMHLSLGISYIDTTAELGKTYGYKIRFGEDKTELETPMTLYHLHQPEFDEMVFSEVKNIGSQVRLEWKTSVFDTPPFFELYRKQAAGKSDFKKIGVEKGTRVNDTGDSTVFIAIDTTGIQGISYDYFLAAIDFLGNEGNHSDTVRLQLGGRQNVPAVYNLKARSDSLGILLSWRALPPNPSLKNLLLLRSDQYDNGYTLLTTLPVRETQYIDRDVEGGKLYYYQIIVEGAANYSIPTPRISGRFTENIQLDAPYDVVTAAIEGGIELRWKYRDTTQIKGYRVYRSTNPYRDFELISETIQIPIDTNLAVFADTTVMDDKTSYYYAVTAVSKTSNQSPSSLVVSGKATGITAVPAPVSLKSLWLSDTTVSITWKDMMREVPGIVGYKVYKDNEMLEEISENNFFVDTDINEIIDTLRPGQEAWYWVKAVGEKERTGNVGTPIRVRAPVDKPQPPTVQLYQQKKTVQLLWESMLTGGIKHYKVYRSEGEGEPSLIATIHEDNDRVSFEDSKVKSNNIYYYYVTAVNQYDIESERSTEVFVRF